MLGWPWPAARAVMAAFDALGLLALVAFAAWLTLRRDGWPVTLFVASLMLAAAQHYTVLRLGQPAILVVALLVGRRWSC